MSKTSNTPKKTAKAKTAAAAESDETLAAKLINAKHPEKLIEKAQGGKPAIWRLLAKQLIPLSHAECARFAGQTADKVPAATVIDVATTLPPDAFGWKHVRWALDNSYREDADAWERAISTLPTVVHDLLAPVRANHGIALPLADKERALEAFAQAAFDDTLNMMSYAADVVDVLEPNPAFHARLLARLSAKPDQKLSSDLVTALAAAPFETIVEMVERHSLGRLNFFHFADAMEKHDHSAAQQHHLMTLGGELGAWEAMQIAKRAHARGEVMPTVEDLLVEYFTEGRADSVEEALVLDTLPPERYAAFAAAVIASGTREAACASILKDPSLDDELLETLVSAVDRESWSNTHDSIMRPLRDLLPNRAYAIDLIDRLWATLTEDATFAPTYVGRKLRLLLQRAKFTCTRGMANRPWELVLPNADFVWAADVGDMVGHDDPFLGMTDAEVERLFETYQRLDWDGQLGIAGVFQDRLPARVEAMTPTPIEDRPWTELVALVEQTSFDRLEDGETRDEVLTKLFGRSEPLADRIAIAERIAEREAAFSAGDPKILVGLRAAMWTLKALAPHMIAAAQPLPPALADSALRLLRHDVPDDVRDLLLALPRPQVDRWVASLSSDKAPTVKKRGKALAKLLDAS